MRVDIGITGDSKLLHTPLLFCLLLLGLYENREIEKTNEHSKTKKKKGGGGYYLLTLR